MKQDSLRPDRGRGLATPGHWVTLPEPSLWATTFARLRAACAAFGRKTPPASIATARSPTPLCAEFSKVSKCRLTMKLVECGATSGDITPQIRRLRPNSIPGKTPQKLDESNPDWTNPDECGHVRPGSVHIRRSPPKSGRFGANYGPILADVGANPG